MGVKRRESRHTNVEEKKMPPLSFEEKKIQERNKISLIYKFSSQVRAPADDHRKQTLRRNFQARKFRNVRQTRVKIKKKLKVGEGKNENNSKLEETMRPTVRINVEDVGERLASSPSSTSGASTGFPAAWGHGRPQNTIKSNSAREEGAGGGGDLPSPNSPLTPDSASTTGMSWKQGLPDGVWRAIAWEDLHEDGERRRNSSSSADGTRHDHLLFNAQGRDVLPAETELRHGPETPFPTDERVVTSKDEGEEMSKYDQEQKRRARQQSSIAAAATILSLIFLVLLVFYLVSQSVHLVATHTSGDITALEALDKRARTLLFSGAFFDFSLREFIEVDPSIHRRSARDELWDSEVASSPDQAGCSAGLCHSHLAKSGDDFETNVVKGRDFFPPSSQRQEEEADRTGEFEFVAGVGGRRSSYSYHNFEQSQNHGEENGEKSTLAAAVNPTATRRSMGKLGVFEELESLCGGAGDKKQEESSTLHHHHHHQEEEEEEPSSTAAFAECISRLDAFMAEAADFTTCTQSLEDRAYFSKGENWGVFCDLFLVPSKRGL